MAQESVKLNIPLLNGGNFVFWKTKVKAVLVRDELWDVVNSPKPEAADAAWDKKNNKAMAYITLSVEDPQLIHFAHLDIAHEAWSALTKKYERSTFGSRLYLRRKLYGIHYTSGPMSNHIDAIMNVVGLLRGSGKPLDDEEIVAILLVSLPESYSGLVTALEGRDEADLTIEYVTGKILDEYQRRHEAKATSSNDNPEVALRSMVAGKNDNSRGFKNNFRKTDFQKTGDKRTKETRECYHCHKPGHLKADCRWFKAVKDQQKKSAESAKPTVEVKSYTGEHVAFEARDKSSAAGYTKWCVDSGATSHMTNDVNFFTTLRNIDSTVEIADGSMLTVTGVGHGCITCEVPDGVQKVQLQDVLYVPQLHDNLISVKRILEKGFRIVFEGDQCRIYQDQRIIAEAEIDGNLFRIKTKDLKNTAYTAREEACIHQWHRRMGHRDEAAIKNLISKELATGIRVSSCSHEITCECCIKAKLSETKFTENRQREKEPMRLIHSDLCGPMQTPTPSGNRYFLTLIDDFSRFTVVRLVKSKDEVADAVKEYVAAMKTRFGRCPLAMRTDNGREYISRDLEKFLRTNGVEHQYTVVYTPQQNGVAERKNRHLVESAKSMLLDAGLDNRFWGEAILTATYLQNRMVSRSVDKTPFQLFTGKKPELKHIRIFGSRVFSLIPKQKRQKWDDKAVEGFLVGYSGQGYRILDPETNKVRISRSVKIIEESPLRKPNVTIPSMKTLPKQTTVETSRDQDAEETESQEYIEENIEENVNEEYGTPPPSPEGPTVRVSTRPNKSVPPARYGYKVSSNFIKEPETWSDLTEMPHREQKLWLAAAEREMKTLNDYQVWTLTDLPPGKRPLPCKWVFKGKIDGEGRVHTYKARLVAKGFSQHYGKDYDETFAPVVKHETVRALLTLAAQKRFHVRHLDVKSAYLNGELKEEIYLEQPQGFIESGNEDKVLKLNKSIYGLKQAARVWNETATEALSRIGFKPVTADPCLYVKREKNDNPTYILLYVDDLLVVAESAKVSQRVGQELQRCFEIKDLGEVKHYLGIQIERESNGSFLLNQKTKILKLLECYNLLEPRPTATPMEPGFLAGSQVRESEFENNTIYRKVMGSLLYIATVTRPDIAVAVGLLCRRVENPTNYDWKAAKRVIRYLASTVDKKLKLTSDGNTELSCYVDADWAGDREDRKSTSGYVFLLGNSVIAWSSRKQTAVAVSSTEAEYLAASFASKELLWLRQLLTDLNGAMEKPTIMFEDNQGCIQLIKNDKCGARTKHIDVAFHHIRDLQRKGILDVKYCPSEEMLADTMTKPLPKEKFKFFTERLGLL